MPHSSYTLFLQYGPLNAFYPLPSWVLGHQLTAIVCFSICEGLGGILQAEGNGVFQAFYILTLGNYRGGINSAFRRNSIRRSRDWRQMNSARPGHAIQNKEQYSCCVYCNTTVVAVPNNFVQFSIKSF